MVGCWEPKRTCQQDSLLTAMRLGHAFRCVGAQVKCMARGRVVGASQHFRPNHHPITWTHFDGLRLPYVVYAEAHGGMGLDCNQRCTWPRVLSVGELCKPLVGFLPRTSGEYARLSPRLSRALQTASQSSAKAYGPAGGPLTALTFIMKCGDVIEFAQSLCVRL